MLSSSRLPRTTLIKLEQNYRSTQVILDAANGVIAETPAGWARRCSREAGWGAGHAAHCRGRAGRAEWLAGELSRRVADGDLAYEGWRSCTHQFAVAAARRGVPVPGIRTGWWRRELLRAREVKDVLAYLRLIANPGTTRRSPAS